MMDVSVIVPSYREDSLIIGRAMDSALFAGSTDIINVADDMDLLEMELVFDCSYHEVQATHNRAVFSLHAGVCHARNLGIFTAEHDLIVPLDADDELLPDALEKLVAAWQPGTLVYGGWMEGEQYLSPPPPEMLSRKNIAHATWLFHKNDWRRVGGYDPDFNIGGEDWAFMCALVAAGVTPVRLDEPIYRRAVQNGSRTDQARSRAHFILQLLREKYPAVMA